MLDHFSVAKWPPLLSPNLQTEVQGYLHGMTEGTITQGYAIWSSFGKQSPLMAFRNPGSFLGMVIGGQDFWWLRCQVVIFLYIVLYISCCSRLS